MQSSDVVNRLGGLWSVATEDMRTKAMDMAAMFDRKYRTHGYMLSCLRKRGVSTPEGLIAYATEPDSPIEDGVVFLLAVYFFLSFPRPVFT